LRSSAVPGLPKSDKGRVADNSLGIHHLHSAVISDRVPWEFEGFLFSRGPPCTILNCLSDHDMTFRPIAAAVLALVLLASAGAEQCRCAPVEQSDSHPDFRQLLQKLVHFSPDPCGPPYGEESNWHSLEVESPIFQKAEDIVTQELNASPAGPGSPRDRAEDVLSRLARMSADINASWPEENRFHSQVLDLSPALVIKMTARTHARFFVFAIPEENSGKPNRIWHSVGSDEESAQHDVPQSYLDLYPLHRGPSGNTRFLAKFVLSGCAGSVGVAYDAREWNPKGAGDLDQIIKQAGSFGLDGRVRGFPQIGKLRTEGPAITLPYCWFSPIDTWDNPSLCAVDTYDISGDHVKFRTRAYNRPDLLPIAKAIEYAEQRDYPAVLAYCGSSEVALKLVRDIEPQFFAGDLQVTRTGVGKERVEMESTYFEVEKRAGRWLVVAFNAE